MRRAVRSTMCTRASTDPRLANSRRPSSNDGGRDRLRFDLREPGALNGLPTTGPDVVQVARTYYGALPGSGRGFSFAPTGERTIIDTLLQAIGRARRHIYIEDQYLTPPAEFAFALAAAATRVSGPLVILVPSTTDQPFGLARRQAFIQQMREAWGDRFKVGILRKRFSCTQTTFQAAKGRLSLTADLGEADNVIEIGPVARLPEAPFWLVVDGEAMRAYQKVAGFTSPSGARFHVDRAEATHLFKKDSGTKRSAHKAGAAVVTRPVPGHLRAYQDGADRRCVCVDRVRELQPPGLLLRWGMQHLRDARHDRGR